MDERSTDTHMRPVTANRLHGRVAQATVTTSPPRQFASSASATQCRGRPRPSNVRGLAPQCAAASSTPSAQAGACGVCCCASGTTARGDGGEPPASTELEADTGSERVTLSDSNATSADEGGDQKNDEAAVEPSPELSPLLLLGAAARTTSSCSSSSWPLYNLWNRSSRCPMRRKTSAARGVLGASASALTAASAFFSEPQST
mmetsp:Transcript_57474/g.166929  ORF Transcript_57474/g.166929 Transcript_57474/m.166929 type:complete len:203 (+) Transcript_57474:53-661(+)